MRKRQDRYNSYNDNEARTQGKLKRYDCAAIIALDLDHSYVYIYVFLF